MLCALQGALQPQYALGDKAALSPEHTLVCRRLPVVPHPEYGEGASLHAAIRIARTTGGCERGSGSDEQPQSLPTGSRSIRRHRRTAGFAHDGADSVDCRAKT